MTSNKVKTYTQEAKWAKALQHECRTCKAAPGEICHYVQDHRPGAMKGDPVVPPDHHPTRDA